MLKSESLEISWMVGRVGDVTDDSPVDSNSLYSTSTTAGIAVTNVKGSPELFSFPFNVDG